jgi:hypothetical protein
MPVAGGELPVANLWIDYMGIKYRVGGKGRIADLLFKCVDAFRITGDFIQNQQNVGNLIDFDIF